MSRKKKINHHWTRWGERSIPQRSHRRVSVKQKLPKGGPPHGACCGQKAMSPTKCTCWDPSRHGIKRWSWWIAGFSWVLLSFWQPFSKRTIIQLNSAFSLDPSCATRGQTSHSGGALVSLQAWDWKSIPPGSDGGLKSVSECVYFASCDHLSPLLAAIFCSWLFSLLNFLGGSAVKNLPDNTGASGDVGLIPGWRKSPGGGHGNPLQYSCLENPMDRGA